MSKMKRSAACVVALSIAALAFTGTASAHNINLKESVSTLKKRHVQRAVDDPGRNYTKARTHCRYKFKDHSHWAVCTVTYETADDVNACRETINGYIQIRGSRPFAPFARDGVFFRHSSRSCSRYKQNSRVDPVT